MTQLAFHLMRVKKHCGLFRMLGLAFGILVLFTSFRAPTRLRVVQIARALEIQSLQRSPAKLAFESILPKQGEAEDRTVTRVELSTLQKHKPTLKSETVRYFMEPLKISRADMEKEKAAITRPTRESLVAALKAAREEGAPLNSAPARTVALAVERPESRIDELPGLSAREQQRLRMAKASNPGFLDDTKLPSTEQLLDEELHRNGWDQPTAQARGPSIPHRVSPAVNGGAISVYTNEPSASPDLRRPVHPKNMVVRGQLSIPKGAGVAMLDGYYIEVYWLNDGVAQATGVVDHDFNYEVAVDELMGTVVAKMFDGDGREVAMGSRRITPLDSAERLRTAHLELKNRNRQDVAMRGLEGDAPVHVLNGMTGEEEKVSENNYRSEGTRANSVTGVRAAAAGYYPTLAYARAGNRSELSFLSKGTVQALLEIVRDESLMSQHPENGSVVWGKVFQDGKPVDGVRIEVEGYPDLKPLYFNNAFGAFYFPNRELAATSQNGLFILAHLPRGIYAFRAYRGEAFFGHGVVEVDDGTLSNLEIHSTHLRYQTHLKTFDAFSGEAMPADVELQSLPSGLRVDGYARPMVPANEQLAFYQASFASDQYLPSQGSYHNSDESIFVPAISTAWANELRQRARISHLPDSGVIVGFTQEPVEDVYLSHQDGGHHRIVYFDARGEMTHESVAGGGFVIYNVFSGSHSVAVKEKTGLVNSQILPVTPGWASVVRFHF